MTLIKRSIPVCFVNFKLVISDSFEFFSKIFEKKLILMRMKFLVFFDEDLHSDIPYARYYSKPVEL